MAPKGTPRGIRLPYARHWIDEADIEAVTAALRSDWLTTGPKVGEFEGALAEFVGARDGVAVSSGTAALHVAMYGAGIGPGDEVIVPAITFVATANAVVYQGGTPVFADVEPSTLLLDPADVETRITPQTKAIAPVDYAGQPCDYDALQEIAERHGLMLITDSCHALGAEYKGRKVGTLAHLTVFSFHPAKHITTGEGGMVMTDDEGMAKRMRVFRNHGITTARQEREDVGTWFYEMVDLGYNLRITDFQCALGMSQLRRLPEALERRRALADRYEKRLSDIPGATPLAVHEHVRHAFHLYVVRIGGSAQGRRRNEVFDALRSQGIGVNVHYIPVHLQPFYRERFGTKPGTLPAAEGAYDDILTLPLFPQMRDADVDEVVDSLHEALSES